MPSTWPPLLKHSPLMPSHSHRPHPILQADIERLRSLLMEREAELDRVSGQIEATHLGMQQVGGE